MVNVTYSNNAGRTVTVDVPSDVALAWETACYGTSRLTPVNRHGLPLRPFAAGTYRGDPVPAGVFVDWQHDTTREFIWTERRRPVTDQATHAHLAAVFGPFQHDLHPYRAADCWARRVDRGQARGNQPRDPRAADYRRYSNRRWSPVGIATATARAQAQGTRCFGVELEFNRAAGTGAYGGSHGYVTERAPEIAAAARRAGLTFVERWGHYGRNMSTAGWQGTYDSTTTGGEIISDILAGDDASLEEVRTMLAIIRQHGGQAGERQGTHVHVDCRDLDTADKVRLVDNLQAIAPLLNGYLPASRRSGYWCGEMSASTWAYERQCVAAGHGGSGSHNNAFNLGHLYGASSRVEFRQFGHSLNSAKLRCWIRVVQSVVTATKHGAVFTPGVTQAEFLASLRTHGGLSASAATRWADTVARRTGQPVAA